MPQKLRMMVLKTLATTPYSGYGLVKTIEKATSWKPSYGSMYPQLEQLKKEKLVTVKKDGRKKIYTLTKKGEKADKEFSCNHSAILTRMQESMNTMAHLMGTDMRVHKELMEIVLSVIEKGDNPFKNIVQTSTKMKVAVLKH